MFDKLTWRDLLYCCTKRTWQKGDKIMEREEILAKAQKENKGKDIVELDAQKRSTYVAFTVGGLLIIAIAIVDFIVTKRFPFGVMAGLQGMLATAFLVKYITLRKKHELVVTICYSLLFVGFLALWITQLIKGF